MKLLTNTNAPESGFTIVELIVTLAVGIILIFSLNSIVVNHSYISRRSRALLLANSYVESKVEALRSAGFSNLSDGTTNTTSELPSELKVPRSSSVVISTQSASVKRVVINVSYNEQGASRSYSYTTYVGELGVAQY